MKKSIAITLISASLLLCGCQTTNNDQDADKSTSEEAIETEETSETEDPNVVTYHQIDPDVFREAIDVIFNPGENDVVDSVSSTGTHTIEYENDIWLISYKRYVDLENSQERFEYTYNLFSGLLEENRLDGICIQEYEETEGYMIVNGVIDGNDEVYGFLFLVDDLYVGISVYSVDESAMDTIDSFCDYVGVSHPTRR